MHHDQEDNRSEEPADTGSDAAAQGKGANKFGGSTSLSADGTTSGGIGSGAEPGTGGGVGNWDEGGSAADAGAATEGKEIVYPAGTGPAGSSDWNARQSGSGRDSGSEDAESDGEGTTGGT